MKTPKIHPLIARAKEYGSIPGLDTVKALLEELDNPQEKLQIIHVAGTNGKGSIASFLEGMLMENHYQVGLFTSPYFHDPREMIRFNRELIPQKDFEKILETLAIAVEKMLIKGKSHPTEFEIYVALAFYYFSRISTDLLILEAGLGGREDATNVIDNPILSVITQIGLDHTELLGNTLEEIADHKGGIIKTRVPVVLFPQEPRARRVLESIARKSNSPLYSFEPNQVTIHSSSLEEQCFSVDFTSFPGGCSRTKIRLPGKHQVFNGATALLALYVLQKQGLFPMTFDSIAQGLFAVQWPGRFEVLGREPLTIVDGAHNLAAAKALTGTLDQHCRQYSITLILGMLEDKDVEGFLSEIIPYVDRVILTKPLNPRAMPPQQLKEQLQGYAVDTFLEPSISKASFKALSITDPSGMILGVGSLYMIGEARKVFLKYFRAHQPSPKQS